MSDILSHCRDLIGAGDALAIATQLKADGELCNSNSKRCSSLPSPLAALLPSSESRNQSRKQLVYQIAEHLTPEGLLKEKLSDDIVTLLYDSLRDKILAYVRYRMQDDNVIALKHGERDDDFETLMDWRGLLLRTNKEGEEEGVDGSASNGFLKGGKGEAFTDNLGVGGMQSRSDEEVHVGRFEPTDQDIAIALKVLKHKIQKDTFNSDAYSAAFDALEQDLNHRQRIMVSSPAETVERIETASHKQKNGILIEIEGAKPGNGVHINGPSWKQVTQKYESERYKSSKTAAAAASASAVAFPPARLISNRRHNACYICRYLLTNPHPLYPSMCSQCAEFNLAASIISLPTHLDLRGKNCLVTGARINLGYYTALRLLRCGARVIASSRYPWDTQSRYENEDDFHSFRERLKIVGADFRNARDAFVLVELVKRQLTTEEWGAKLDILINNAAQTATDPIATEEKAVKREEELAGSRQVQGRSSLFIDHDSGYRARVRGGGKLKELLPMDISMPGLAIEGKPENEHSSGSVVHANANENAELTAPSTYSPSSWLQRLSEIPYEDVISAHSVNTFVPLILCRELLPLMGSKSSPSSKSTSRKPEAYIINVSAREGMFDDSPESRHKDGRHVHTNMAKAGLNMITETEASVAWKDRRVAMNSVDPGFLSAAPEYAALKRGELPIGWEDGAARVLWSIAVGEREEKAVWGRFLKDFGVFGVDVGRGR